MKHAKIVVITGGTRSGKSRLALQRMSDYERKIFLATAVATDDEMKSRIEQHKKHRGPDFVTVEEPIYLAEAIRSRVSSADAVLVDCLTFWLNNLFHYFNGDQERISSEIRDFLQLLEERLLSLILVTNEINMGVIPPDSLSRRFVDEQGRLNQEVVRCSDEAILMISGVPHFLKREERKENIPSPSQRVRAEAPTKALAVWDEKVRAISPLDQDWRAKARQRLREQTRPEGSLGELEQCLERIVAIQQKDRPSVAKKRIIVFAGDHGVEREGVSLYPKSVTPAMVYNFLSGGATINAFSRAVGAEVHVVDVGVDHEFGYQPNLISRKIRRGTSNIKKTQAMTEAELVQALETGWEMARRAKEDGVELLGMGEMGIANTTSASAVISALTRTQPEGMTGRGTGIDNSMLERKIQVIREALESNRPFLTNAFSVLQSLGGFEIAAIAGCVIGAASLNIPCIIDGWIASAGALVAIQSNPAVLDYLFFAHESEERGHRLLLEELDARPLLRLSMRLGEGTGACLAMGILEAAVRAYNEVATFGEAKVDGRKE